MAGGRKISWGIYSLLIIPLLYLSSLLTEALSEVWPAAPGVCGELEAGRGAHQALAWASPKKPVPTPASVVSASAVSVIYHQWEGKHEWEGKSVGKRYQEVAH